MVWAGMPWMSKMFKDGVNVVVVCVFALTTSA